MFLDRILGNVNRAEGHLRWADRTIDPLYIDWRQLEQRSLKATSESGVQVNLILPLGVRLSPGDVLAEDHNAIIVLQVRPCPVLIVCPFDVTEMGRLALELGNQHLPTQVCLGELIVADEPESESVLLCLRLPFERATRAFMPTLTALPAATLGPSFSIRKRVE